MDSLIGLRFGKLVVVSEEVVVSEKSANKYFCGCVCDCGNNHSVSRYHLLREKSPTESCGCSKRTRGGRSKEFTYNTWNMLIQRCYNPGVDSYETYGAVGIRVCDRWLGCTGYDNFIEDMGPRPSKNHTIDRINVNFDYSPENCVWTDDLSWQMYNQKTRSTNTSGRTGVRYDNSSTGGSGKWRASICKNRKAISKRFHTFEEAVAQREAWELELYGFIKDNQ